MKGRRQLTTLLAKIEPAIRWLTLIATVFTIVSFLAALFAGVNLGSLETASRFLGAHFTKIWLGTLTLSILLLSIWTWSLHRRFTGGFLDDFKGGLAEQWDFVGDWRIRQPNELLVTNSDPGGLTKAGAFWENYTLDFEAKILNKCLGVIVRAQDLNNYHMFQIKKDRIRPHRRVTVPVQYTETPDDRKDKNEIKPRPVQYATFWDIPPDLETDLDMPLADWFRVKITVRGEAVSITIDGKTVFVAESLIKQAAGKIGFRNAGSEKALVRRVRISLQP